MSTKTYKITFLVEIEDEEFFLAAKLYGYQSKEEYVRETLPAQLEGAEHSTIAIEEIPDSSVLPLHEKRLG